MFGDGDIEPSGGAVGDGMSTNVNWREDRVGLGFGQRRAGGKNQVGARGGYMVWRWGFKGYGAVMHSEREGEIMSGWGSEELRDGKMAETLKMIWMQSSGFDLVLLAFILERDPPDHFHQIY